MIPFHKITQYLIFACLLFASCNTTKFLAEDEYLVKENEIEFTDDSPLSKQFGIESTMSTILQQQPNSRYLGMKREWLYIQSQRKDKDYWLKDFMDRHGEPPVIYSDSLTALSEKSLANYMFNQGYFDATVSSEVKTKNKKAYVQYDITANTPYYIDQIEYVSQDTGITTLIDSLQRTSLLQRGSIIKDVTYQLEKGRITQAFLNSGYADFYANLVSPLQLDTTGGENNLTLEIYQPGRNRQHLKKRVGNVYVYSDYLIGENALPLDTVVDRDLTYYLLKPEATVDLPTISQKIYLNPGGITRKSNFDETYRGLSDLGVFKFISVTPEPRTDDPSLIDYSIQLTPNKKYVFDTGLDLNYSTIQTEGAGRNLLGLTGSARVENRNLWGKAINLALKGEVGAEINLAEVDSFNTISANVEAIMNIPRFVGFPGTLKFLSLVNLGNRKLMTQEFIDNLNQRASTRLSAQYQRVFVTDFYSYTSANLKYGYDVPVNTRKRYSINTIGLELYLPDTLSQFSEITRGQEYVLRSFLGDRLLTGFLYRDFSFFYRSKSSQRGNYWVVNAINEVSGLEVWAVNSIYNAATNKSLSSNIKTGARDSINFARYTRFEFQYKYQFNLTNKQQLVFRINPGAIFTLDDQNVPFVKQFFMGGPQSLRAWQVREVGPGANPISREIENTSQPFFSAGDVKLEMNLEYRFDLFWLLKSAVFLDMGNVWLLDDPEETGGEFTSDFWKQIAIGTGVGLRLDIDFVLFRLDMGYKLRNPYQTNGSYLFHHSGNPLVLNKVFDDISFNLAIGYPF